MKTWTKPALQKAVLPALGLIVGLLGAPLSPYAAEPAAPRSAIVDTLDVLEKSFANITNVQTEFVQEKQLALLQQKVQIKGTIAVQNPDMLAWRVTDPIRYTLVIRNTTLQQWDGESDHVQRISLAGNPVFQVAIGQLRAWFGGQFHLLLQDFDASVVSRSPLALEFVPREGSFARQTVARVRLTFRDDERYVKDLEIDEKSGDKTRISFTNTVLNAPVDPRTWEVKPHGR